MNKNTTHVFNSPDLKNIRREMRSNATPAEVALWSMLKGKKIANLRFRRQYSAGRHILDFYCPAHKFAIELDGDYHFNGFVDERDYQRDAELWEKYGIHTLRFENKVVFEQPETIINSILAVINGEYEFYSPHPPLIQEGESDSLTKLKGSRGSMDKHDSPSKIEGARERMTR